MDDFGIATKTNVISDPDTFQKICVPDPDKI